MNVSGGGKLHMDVSKAYEKADYPATFFSHIFYRKKITIKSNTLLFKILKCSNLKVNSIHKQSISEVAKDLTVTAQEDNGVIQCIEKPEHCFYIGVQFHPEFLIYKKVFRNIFLSLVKASHSNQMKPSNR
jgi:putative glutamine amidotransferase